MKLYSIIPTHLNHTEFLIDLKIKELALLTTAYDCGALLITLVLNSETDLADGNVLKVTFILC